MRPKRILIHDYPGYAFPIQLSRSLADRGHHVTHVYSANVTAPRGELSESNSHDRLKIVPVRLPGTYSKDSFKQRYFLETKYGSEAAKLIPEVKPEIVISANSPTLVSDRLIQSCRKHRVTYINWVQDLLGIAAKSILSKKIPIAGSLIGDYLISIDKKVARLSDGHIVITEDFRPILESWGVPRDRTFLLHNWAPLEELPQRQRQNEWAVSNNLNPEKVRFIYSGTLAMKHNPQLLLELARSFDRLGNAELIVISEGKAINWLTENARQQNVKSLKTMSFQPFSEVPNVLGSADVLVVILEPEASIFSVPSKILSYLCAGRSILGAIPEENLAAKTIVGANAGLVSSPTDTQMFLNHASQLCESPETRNQMGQAARQYAEETFNISDICSQVEAIMDSTLESRTQVSTKI